MPNILLFLVDCLGSAALAEASRNRHVPNVQRLITSGTWFHQTVASATTTTPSVASLLTGRLPFTHGVRSLRGYKLNPGIVTLAEILREQGYYTHAETTGPLTDHTELNRGFETYIHRTENLYTEAWDPLLRRLRNLPSDRPWFCLVHMFELHEPPAVPREFRRRSFGATPYVRAMSALDRTRLAPLLDIAGSNAIVALTGDHGERVPRFSGAVRALERLSRTLGLGRFREIFERKHGHGFSVDDDLVLVPLVLAGPGVPANLVVNAPIRHIDLLPSVLDLCGIDEGKYVGPGWSVSEFFEGTGAPRPGYSEAVGVRLPDPQSWLLSVRHEGFKLVKRLDGSRTWLWKLSDVRTNRISDFPDVASRLETILKQFQEGARPDFTGEGLSDEERLEIEEHLKDLGYLD